MKIQLIPVVGIAGYGKGVPVPDKGPYWEHLVAWETFHQESNQQSGFPDKLVSYQPGSALYELSCLSDGNLRKLVILRSYWVTKRFVHHVTLYNHIFMVVISPGYMGS